MSWDDTVEQARTLVYRGRRTAGRIAAHGLVAGLALLGSTFPAFATQEEQSVAGSAEAGGDSGDNSLATKAQQDMTPSEVSALQAPLEGVVERSWLKLPNDQSRPWHITAVHSPRGIELYAVKHQENIDNVVTSPERYLVMEMSSMGKRVFNLDASRGALPVAGLTRIRQETQPLAGAEADGTVLSSPLSDPNFMEFYANLTGDVNDPNFYADNLISDPSLLFKLLVVNNLIEDVAVPGSFEGNTKPGRAIPTQYLVEPDGYGKLSDEDFSVGYMLQRVMGAKFLSGGQWLPSRIAIFRGETASDNVGRTQYRARCWPVDPDSKSSAYGSVDVDLYVGWDDNGRLEGNLGMSVVEDSLTDNVSFHVYAHGPPEGQIFGTNPIENSYTFVSPSTPSGGASWERLLGAGALRHLILPDN